MEVKVVRKFNECERVEEIAALLAAGDVCVVTDEEQAFFDVHINSCDDCTGLFEELKEITNSLKNLDEPELDELFHFELMERIRGQKVQTPVRRRNRMQTVYRYFGTAAAALAAVVVVSVVAVGLNNGLTNFDRTGTLPFGVMTDENRRDNGYTIWNEGITMTNETAPPAALPPGARVAPLPTDAPTGTDIPMPAQVHAGGGLWVEARSNSAVKYSLNVIVEDTLEAFIAINNFGTQVNVEVWYPSVYTGDITRMGMYVVPDNFGTVYEMLSDLGAVEVLSRTQHDLTDEIEFVRNRIEMREGELDRLYGMLGRADEQDMDLLNQRLDVVWVEVINDMNIMNEYRNMVELNTVNITLIRGN
jgi:hypothetical protein